ncbi:DUF4097 family beta strand repeat-containing protein [Longispora albida]|uniref:DUF4097 family beta strand repeat-containing protein n=1 Tax=Longispora albida TaxID=203523 RepID=UPI000364B638|nr:DUF4097 family beta strand repeat-containing protein [Longispora albida]
MYSYDTTAPIAATIDIPAGRIQLIAADRADTTVEIRPADAGKSRDVELAGQTTVEFTEGVLRIKASAKNQYFGASGAIEVTVQLPAGSRAEVKAASAEIRAVGRLGDTVVESAHGSIKVDEAASARLTIAAGDITVGRLGGSAEIKTEKGDITVSEATSGTVVLRTQAGNITAGAAAGVSATLDAGTSYGRISNALRNTGGTPGLTIHATTAYGNIAASSL